MEIREGYIYSDAIDGQLIEERIKADLHIFSSVVPIKKTDLEYLLNEIQKNRKYVWITKDLFHWSDKVVTLTEKLDIAVEALEKLSSIDRFYLADSDTAREALEKIRGEKCQTKS